MCSIVIDGVAVEAAEGSTVLQAARAAGIRIPTLCYLKERSAIASCRLCVVEVEGEPHPVPACATPAREGMVVTTRSERLAAYRKTALELVLSSKGAALANLAQGDGEIGALCRELGVSADANGAGDAPGADAAGDSLLSGDGFADGVPSASGGTVVARFPLAHPNPSPKVEGNPFLSFDPNLCIKCQRCVGACNRAARNHSLGTRKRGATTLIAVPFGPAWRTSACESCGNCAQACPTGAISLNAQPEMRGRGSVAAPADAASDGAAPTLTAGAAAGEACTSASVASDSAVRYVRTTCPHCGVGCQLELAVKDGRIVGTRGAQGASNRGLLCVKGRSESFDFVSAPDRLTTPLVRSAETGELEPATWDEALGVVARRFGELRDAYGGKALAAFACSRSTNEDVYLFQKMARVALKTNNVDSCARV